SAGTSTTTASRTVHGKPEKNTNQSVRPARVPKATTKVAKRCITSSGSPIGQNQMRASARPAMRRTHAAKLKRTLDRLLSGAEVVDMRFSFVEPRANALDRAEEWYDCAPL